VPEIDASNILGIEKLFAALVFWMLLEEGMISEELARRRAPGSTAASASTVLNPLRQAMITVERPSANTYQTIIFMA